MSAAATVCPYCRAGFEPDEPVTACPACATPHHADCFAENGGCTVFGCTAAPADEPKISVAPADFQPAFQPPPASLYGLALTAPPPFAGPPPPPLPPGSLAPPYAPTFPAYAYGSYTRPKSRVAFVLLAVFLGAFGGHNFYAGYTKKAVIQLCLTLFTCFWASLFMWIWAIVEACTVTMDDDGVLLA